MDREIVGPACHPAEAFKQELPFSRAVRSGDMIWLSAEGDFGHGSPRPVRVQAAHCLSALSASLAEVGADLTDLVKLLVFFRSDETTESEVLGALAFALPPNACPAITALPVPYLPYPGCSILVEGIAMRAADGTPLARHRIATPEMASHPAPFSQGIRCGKMIFLSAQWASLEGTVAAPGDIVSQTRQLMRQLSAGLATCGAGFGDVVKINRWYLGHGTVEDFEPAALACAAHFTEPGPAATGIPLPAMAQEDEMIRIEMVAMLGEDGAHLPRRHAWPDSLWDWTTSLPYHHGLKCHDMIFLGGQVSLDKQGRAVDPNQLAAQTRTAMGHIEAILSDLGATPADIVKLTTMYEGPSGLPALRESLLPRAERFTAPGPATTEIAQPALAYPGMIIEIDAFAMTEPDH